MRVLKGILIALLVVVIVTAVLFGVACLCKAFDWLPNITDWLESNIFDKIGLTFFGNIGK